MALILTAQEVPNRFILDIKRIIVPSKRWRVRIGVVFSLISFDYIMTGIFCRTFEDEANLLIRTFMIYFNSVPLGLCIFMLSFYFPIYSLLCYFSNRNWRPERSIFVEFTSEYGRPLFDIFIGLGVASRHFEGAMSWILPLTNRLWLALGFTIYLILVHLGSLIDTFLG